MATPAQHVGGLPPQALNQQDSVGMVSRESLARRVAEGHRKGLAVRRGSDLTREKYLMHIIGIGDMQWADTWNDSRIVVPRGFSDSVRIGSNILQAMVNNQVAYHTAQQFRFAAESRHDRASRERARFDSLIANHISQTQQLNALAAEAMFMADATGFCPMHAYWRTDGTDAYEPGYNYQPMPGIVDIWVGNPFDTVFDTGAKRNSIRWMSYGRLLPGSLVRQAFGHVPGIEGLTGSKRQPSAATVQTVLRNWRLDGLNVHGTASLASGEDMEEDLVAIVCREWQPGVLNDEPGLAFSPSKEGRLVIVGLRDANAGDANTRRHASAMLLHDGPLPGGCVSAENVYSGFLFDDVHGKPYVADLDDKQMQLNFLEEMADRTFSKAVRAPLMHTGLLSDDTAAWDEDGIVEWQPGQFTQKPEFLLPPFEHLPPLERKIERVATDLFRIGGWQASSRGESNAGDPAAKVIALARADDTVHGPVNQALRDSLCRLMQKGWKLFKQYGDAGWAVNIVGDDYAHLAEEYVDNTKVSDTVPLYRLTSGYGATTESSKQELLSLVSAAGADGQPLLASDEFRKLWPDRDLFDDRNTPQAIRLRHARTAAQAIRDAARVSGFDAQAIAAQYPEQWQQQAVDQAVAQQAKVIHDQLMRSVKPRRDDDLQAHIDALSELTQDDTEDPLVRAVAELRQDVYYTWQQQMYEQQVATQSMPQQGAASTATPSVQSEQLAGTPTSEAMMMAGNEVQQLTRQAMGA